MEYAESHSVPGVLEVNAPLIDEQIRHRGLIDAAAAHAVADRCMSSASVVAAVSDQVGDYVRRFDAAADKVHVVANAVNPARFATPLDDGALDAEAFTVGFVGSLKAWHGVDHLLDAFALVHAEVPQSRLLIVGDGPERESIQTRAERYHLGAAMTMHGAVSHDRIPALLAGMDVGVAPYPELDNFYFSPMKAYEYMAAGLAVVASDTGQLSRLLVDEVHGLLCPPGDVGALAEALLCLQRDPALRRRLGRHAREKVLGQFTWAKAAARIVRLANASRNPPIGSIEDGNYAAQSVCS